MPSSGVNTQAMIRALSLGFNCSMFLDVFDTQVVLQLQGLRKGHLQHITAALFQLGLGTPLTLNPKLLAIRSA